MLPFNSTSDPEAKSAMRRAPPQRVMERVGGYLFEKFARHFEASPVPFEVIAPDMSVRAFGRGAPSFRLRINDAQGVEALMSLDEGRVGGAYLEGSLDIEGDLLAMFALRRALKDKHPLTALWRFIQPLILGQVRTNRRVISAHYDIDPEFFLSFLDPIHPCYTQGIYASDGEALGAALERKFAWCFERCKLKPGDRILEIGPGWGAWAAYAHERGVGLTGITISRASKDHLDAVARRVGADWEIAFSDLLEYESDRQFDAIVIMGVIEHLPQYKRVLDKLAALVRPGGHIFLDGSAARVKYELSSFMVKYIYGGNHSFLVLHDFLAAVAKTPLELVECHEDRHSYFLTFRQWARNFDRNKERIIRRFGDFNYRRFRLYLWGSAYEFLSRNLECYRMILRLPDPRVPSATT